MAKVASKEPKEKKVRERTPEREAASLLLNGAKALGELDKRLARLATEAADVQDKREKLMASIAEARGIVASIGQKPAQA